MFPQSLAVLSAAAAVLLVAAGLLLVAFRLRQFEGLARQATSIFDDRDMRLARPWETPAQKHERVAAHGQAIPPDRGEWGGAS